MDKLNLKETKVSSKEVFKGKILDVFVDTVTLPNGHTATRELIRHCKAAAVLAFDEDNNVILEKQFRYPYNDVLIEIPAGKADKDEDPIITAKRELQEETGYEAGKLTLLGEFYPSVAYTDEIIYLYEAHDLKKKSQHLDEDETLCYFKVSFDEFKKMVKEGQIGDGKTLAALAYYLAK